jgi:ferric-dicitrate binding protein FerR (iron transport regulator)
MRKKNLSDKELDNLLDQLSKSVRGPRGKYTAENSYSQLQERLPFKSRKRIPLFRYAAAASVAIILALSTYILLNNSYNPEMLIVETEGNTKEVVLPDGSHVVLSHYSSLQYPLEFNRKDRTVILSGEAYFDIAKKREHPFSVHSGDICITVLGTQFNVQSYSNDPCIKTTLIKGKVAVSPLDKVKTTILAPNETAYFSKQTGEIYKEATENAMNEIAWKEGKLIFENKPLAEITTDLSNYFNVQIKIDNQHLQTYKMTARFEQNENIEEILNILQSGAGFNWKRNNNTITIIPNH